MLDSVAVTGDGVGEGDVGDPDAPMQALIVDSWFDNYLGVVSLVRVVHGSIRAGDRIKVMATAREYEVDEVGIFTPKKDKRDLLTVGEVGYVIAGIKEIDGAPVGDTLTHAARPCADRLPGFRQIQPRVFAGLYPTEGFEFHELREALERLQMNDASFDDLEQDIYF